MASTERSWGSEEGAKLPEESQSQNSYLVLARRYRPNQFEQVIGQEPVTRTLQNAIEVGRVHHAYLFTGSRGVGKTTVARIMAKALNCDTGATPHPCDTCPTCQEIRQGRAVDVFEIDGASHTGVDDVRQLRENVRYLPTRCRSKIYIIDEVHMLSTSAFNALLKTLEEPPPHVVFIFATTEPHKIPATILSRCQRFDFKRVSGPLLNQHLQWLCEQEGVEIEETGISMVSRASEGSVRDALSLLDQVIAFFSGTSETKEDVISARRVAEVLGVADRRVLFHFSRSILARDPQQALQVIDRLFTSGQDLSQFAKAFLTHLRDLTVVRTCQDPSPLIDATESELKEMIEQARGEGGELLAQHFDHFARVTEQIARSSFPRLLLEMAAIEMARTEPILPLGDLLFRLEQMETRLGGGGPSGKGGGGPSGGRGRLEIPDFSSRSRRGKAGSRTAPATSKTKEHSRTATVRHPHPKLTSVMERWQHLLGKVLKQEPVAAAAFAAGRLIQWDDSSVLLGYPPGSFELQWARDTKKLEAFQSECSKQAGQPLKVSIIEIDPREETPEEKSLSAIQDQNQKKAERVKRLRENAERHPIIREFVETFGASIDSITTKVD